MPLNTEHFEKLAGNDWNDVIIALVNANRRTALEDAQRIVWERGHRPAHLVRSSHGWGVAYSYVMLAIKSGLSLEIMSPFNTKEAAIEFGKKWANEDPIHREFYASKNDLSKSVK